MRRPTFTKEETAAIALDLITDFATEHDMPVSSMTGVNKKINRYVDDCEKTLIKSEFTRVISQEYMEDEPLLHH